MAIIFTSGIFQAQDATGPLPGALLYTYAAGGLTPLATHTNQGGGSDNTNPVVCDTNGQAHVYLGPDAYRMILKTSAGVTVWDTDNVQGDLADSTGSSSVGFIQSGTGAVARTVQSKLRDTVSVMDFGAVGDGSTDDTAAIQAALDTRKTVFFPKPASFYKTTARLVVYYNSHLTGEEGVTTIIRRTSGSGRVFEFVGSNENAVIEHLRIGGSGCTGLGVDGGGFDIYLSTLSLKNVHFEGDLLYGIRANLIHFNAEDCTFGYFVQTAAHASFEAVVSINDGANNTNVNRFENCRFFNCGTTVDGVHFTSGIILTFVNCAWENCGRCLATSSVQNVLLLNCYAERVSHATSQFDFNQSRGRMKVIGGQYSGDTMPTGASMFRVDDDAQLFVEDADIVTGSDSYTYKDATTSAHLPADAAINLHRFVDCRIQGNTSDPLKYLDTTRSEALKAKGWAMINTASSGTIVASSDPGLAITRNGTGDVTCTFSTNICAASTTACVIATGQTTMVIAAGSADNACRVKAFNRTTDAAADDIFQVVIYGA